MSANTKSKSGAVVKGAKGGAGNLTTIALIMMNVTVIAGLANDVQQSFYGLSSVTLFLLGGLLFFLPTGLVAAELASGWSQRGGIFRWVGEGIGTFPAIACLLILWFQTTFTFGSGIPSMSATIGFFTTKYDWAVDFAKNSHSWKVTLPIMIGWLAYYWFCCWLATKGVKTFSNIAKYGVILGTFLPLGVMTILAVVWLCQGNAPAIDMAPSNLVPKWEGMSTLALAAGVFFSFAGIDMNAAHIKDLKKPNRQFPLAIFISMILALLIFIIGTLIIAMVIPNKQINLLYTLFATYRALGATIGFPDLYLVFCWLGMLNSFAALITNLAGPSYMLGQAGRSGFLPKFLQNNNKHGMPSRLMYTQMALMTVIAFIVFLLPNVEGFVALITQAITILYLTYYVLMFVAFLRLRYQQPNRPRGFKVPGGMVGAWIVAGVGIIACIFGIVLAFYPPAQLEAEVGSGMTYDLIIIGLLAFVLIACILIYRASRKHNWSDPTNQFAPFTWQIEGLKKPGKALSNIPTALLSEGQNPMGQPIRHLYDPNEMIDLPSSKEPDVQAAAAAALLKKHGITEPGEPAKVALVGDPNAGMKMIAYEPEPVHTDDDGNMLPAPAAADVKAAAVPTDASADAKRAQARAQALEADVQGYTDEAHALEDEAKDDAALAKAEHRVQVDEAEASEAAAKTAKPTLSGGASTPSKPAGPSSN
ncbi:APC family permease [Bifidobacterium pseudolongum]|uniref:APC family permease n=1 Tax=Bifidobacterium pseudolongum TaxID=1694 RepID=UPI0010206DBD|nr:APC family permease [Bifidobacterium pseudolongum]RYP99611.1 amino acid transporter [Bifidobacterium pseudolongum subsp. globosum]